MTAVLSNIAHNESITSRQEGRLSGLQAPIMRLDGHEGEVLTAQFSPDGMNIASAGTDKKILVFNVYGDISNWCMLKGHSSAILQIKWSCDSRHLYSVSADQSVCIWDVEEGKRVKKLSGHLSIVNTCSVPSNYEMSSSAISPLNILATGSDDGTTRIWDTRIRKCVRKIEHQYQILSVALDNSNRIFSGSLDNVIRVYDLRNDDSEFDVLKGHGDSITGLDINKTGSCLLSNSMDQTIRLWNIQSFVKGESRLHGIIRGATHNFEKNLLRVNWSPDEKLCSAGSADRYVYIWEMDMNILENKADSADGSQQLSSPSLRNRLSGHSGAINEVCFHPLEPIIASASSDSLVFMGEIM